MIGFIIRHPLSVLIAVILHVAVALAVIYQWNATPHTFKMSNQSDAPKTTQAVTQTEPLKTFAVDSSLVEQQIARLTAEEQDKRLAQKRLQEQTEKEKAKLKALQKEQALEQKKAEEAKKRAQQEQRKAEEQRRKADAEKRKADESKRLAEQQKQLVEAQKKRLEAEKAKAVKAQQEAALAEKKRAEAKSLMAKAEQERKAEEAKKVALEKEIATRSLEKQKLEEDALQAMLEKERAMERAENQKREAAAAAKARQAQQQKQLLSLRETYISSIAAKVKDNWRTPARISDQAQCELDITQSPGGNVTSVKVVNCNQFANDQFKDAAEKAVYRSEPLPKPPVEELFERNIKFVFKP
ncbi:MAG: cell envelope integrity protein TolA [Thiotrichales bacterium]|nr:cell envelope integrity protein TolA [Thiotrichales bacterium]